MEKKAEAMAKYGKAAMTEMIIKVLPQMAEAIAKPLESIKETTGFDLTEVMKANTYDAKTTKNVNFTGIPEEMNAAAKEPEA